MAYSDSMQRNSGCSLSISKEQLSKLPAAEYTGGAVVIDRAEQIAEAVSRLRQAPIIGFDTETRPSFRKGVSHKVSLLQLATDSECFLFRIFRTGLTRELIDLLEDPHALKVGVSLRDDFHQLAAVGLYKPAGFVDLQQMVKEYSIVDNSLARIYAILFGHRITKGQRLTNWEASILTPLQINYAAFDAIACIRIYRRLSSGVFNPANSPYILPQDD